MSNTYPTSDIPLGSTSPKVLYNNASNFDDFSVSPLPRFTDRFNKERRTIAGMEMEFQDTLAQLGYFYVGADYIDGVPGLTFTSRNQYTIRAGIAYRVAGTTTLPYVTTGNWATDQSKFVAFDMDAVLRSDLANNFEFLKGAGLIGYKGRTVRDRLDDEVNVMDFGADPTGVLNSYPAFLAAYNVLATDSDYRGGVIRVPAGRYKMSQNLVISEYAPGQVINIHLKGDGVQSTLLDFATAPALSDGVSFIGGSQASIESLTIQNAPRDNLVFNDVHQWKAAELRLQGAGRDNFYNINTFLCTMQDIWAFGAGRNNFTIAGNHTSYVAERCYGMLAANYGWVINGITYSSFTSCASDQNAFDGYALSNIRGVNMFNCGGEENGRSCFLLTTSTASATNVGIPAEYQDIHQLQLIGCQGYFNNKTTPGAFAAFLSAVTADARPIELTMIGCGSKRLHFGDASIVLNGSGGAINYSNKGDYHDGTLVTAGVVNPLGYLEASRNQVGAVPLASAIPANVVQIALPLGDWEVSGMIVYYPTGTTSVNEYHAGINTTANTEGGDQSLIVQGRGFTRVHSGSFNILSPSVRIRSDGTVVAYLIANALFTASTLSASGNLVARKL